MNRFNEIVEEIKNVFENGDPDFKKNQKKGPDKEVILNGTKARGAGYRIRKELKDQFNIVPITSPDQEIPKYDEPTILFFDLKRLEGVPDHFKRYAMEDENIKLLVVDVDRRETHVSGFSFQVDTNYYLKGFERDIDPAISRMVAELYFNVDYAVDEEGIELGGSIVRPYFKTSSLIEYDRSRDILEGILKSVIRKFNPEVIISRGVSGVPPEDDVRMYELAKPLAESLGIESAMIGKNREGYFIKGNIYGRRCLLLEDVVGNANTKIDLIDKIQGEAGRIEACVVLLDRNEGAKDRVEKRRRVQLVSLTDIDMYNKVSAERKETYQKHAERKELARRTY